MNDTDSKGRSRVVSVPSYAAAAYIAVVLLLATGLGVLGWRTHPLNDVDHVVALLVLCAMGVLGSSSQERNVGARIGFSFTSIILLAAVAIVGSFGAAVVGGVTHLLVFNKKPLQVRVFNLGMTSAIGAAGGFVYLLFGGAMDVTAVSGVSPLLLHVGVPLMVADVAICLLNAVILSGIVGLTQGTPIRRFVLGMLGTSGPTYVGYGVLGFLFVILWVPAGVGPFSAVLILAPLFVARWAFVQYGDEQRAHERTLSALVAAVETKDPNTRGHSERVALLCDRMAGSLALSHQDTEALRFAGMLHDIGKLAIPTRVLRSGGAPSDTDLASIATHPARGVEMVGGIEFLKGSIDAILHHHERMDGRGYPAGLSGKEIPLFARIIAVADAFDTLTTSHPHRDALTVERAVAQLHRRAKAHLDPSIVAALERGLLRQAWEPTRLDPGLAATAGRAFDHDDPSASDLMADLTRPVLATPALASSELSHSDPLGADPLRATETAP